MRALLCAAMAVGLAFAGAWCSPAAHAKTVLIVSDDTWEDSRASRTDRPEDDFHDWLEGLGYTVYRSAPRQYRKVSSGGEGAAAALAFAESHGVDLIIVSRITNSPDYAEQVVWNSAPLPMLLLNPCMAASGCWSWFTAGGVHTGAGYGWQDLRLDQPDHPFVAGRATDFSNMANTSGLATLHVAKDATGHVGNGLVVASRTPAEGSPAINDVVIVDWADPPGYFHGTSGATYAARRAFVAGIKCAEDEPPSPAYPLWFSHYTENGKRILAQVIGTLAGADMTPPRVTAVSLNSRPGRTVSCTEPSGIGVRTVTVTFSEAVDVADGGVQVRAVTFDEHGAETGGPVLTPQDISGSGTDTLVIDMGTGAVVDTWVKVTLVAEAIADLSGNALDGEEPAGGTAMGYLYSAAEDFPTGDGEPGGDAVFYVGSLRGDYQDDELTPGPPDGQITLSDVDGFAAAFQADDLDADFQDDELTPGPPDGQVTLSDVDGFAAAFQAGRTLGPLPGTAPPPG